MSLVINADDFGKSAEVNKAINECFNLGYIDRTTIMANMPFAEEAAGIAEAEGYKDKVGIHLNITEGRPLTEGIAKNPYFCNENGEFTAAFYKNTKLRLHMDKKSVQDIYCEIKAQYEKYLELGFTLNHVDSHHHVHTNFPVFKALKKLSDEYDFSSVRLSRNLYTGGSFAANAYKKFYNAQVKKICRCTTEYFGSFSDAKSYFENMEKNSSGAPKSFCDSHSIEVMVHPMYSENGELVDTEIPFVEEILLYEKMR